MDPYVIARESDNAMCLSFSALFGTILIEGFSCAAYDTGLRGLAVCRPHLSRRSSTESRMVLCNGRTSPLIETEVSDNLGTVGKRSLCGGCDREPRDGYPEWCFIRNRGFRILCAQGVAH